MRELEERWVDGWMGVMRSEEKEESKRRDWWGGNGSKAMDGLPCVYPSCVSLGRQ